MNTRSFFAASFFTMTMLSCQKENIMESSFNNDFETTKTQPKEKVNLKLGLKAYFPFSGNTKDASGNGNNGVVYGAVLSGDRFGAANRAYSFNGINSYIQIINSSLPIGNESRSISFWVNFTPFATYTDWSAVFSYGSNNSFGALSDFLISTSSQIDFNTHEYYTVSIPGPNISFNNNWRHVVVTYNGQGWNDTKIYIDGIQQSTQTVNYYGIISLNTFKSTSAYIGKSIIPYANNSYYFNGSIDEIRIYNRILNQSEISYLAGN